MEAPPNGELVLGLVARLPIPVITVDAQGRIRGLNPAAERCFEWDREVAEGQPLELLLPVAPEILGLAGGSGVPEENLPLTLRAQRRHAGPFLLRLIGLVRNGLTALVLEHLSPAEGEG
ncbi:MAG TPA: PAS domain-containing protein [Gammaproteobacteria bacterium]|nr:PAS domain-containing protein [Gammaproteobacteria bacterium]